MAESELTLVSRLVRQIDGLLAALDVDLVGKETGRTIARLKQTANDARLDVRDWEYADSRAEMQQTAAAACKRLEEVRKLVLKASEHGIFGAIDVVDISAQLDAVLAGLQQTT